MPSTTEQQPSPSLPDPEPVQNATMTEEEYDEADAPSFLSCAAEVARLLDLGKAVGVPEARSARYLAHAARKPLLERPVDDGVPSAEGAIVTGGEALAAIVLETHPPVER